MKLSIILPLTIGLMLCSCGDRSQLQVIADARAAAQAYHKAPSPAIADALSDDVLAATESFTDLPAPTFTPDQIIAAPAPAKANAVQSLKSPPPFQSPAGDTSKNLGGQIETVGKMCVYTGSGLSIFAALAAGLVLLIPAVALTLGRFMNIIEDIGVIGVLLLLLGAAFEWLGNNIWLIWSTIAVAAGIAIIRFRPLWLPIATRILGIKSSPKAEPAKPQPVQPIQLRGVQP